jgi:hypothetical protein
MVDDMLNVVSDPIFNHAYLQTVSSATTISPRPGKNSGLYSSKYKLPGSIFGDSHQGYSDTENLFEHICNLND